MFDFINFSFFDSCFDYPINDADLYSAEIEANAMIIADDEMADALADAEQIKKLNFHHN